MNPTENGHKKVGPIVSILVIVLVLIFAALYVFATKLNREPEPTDITPITNAADDPASLQNDLKMSTRNVDRQNF